MVQYLRFVTIWIAFTNNCRHSETKIRSPICYAPKYNPICFRIDCQRILKPSDLTWCWSELIYCWSGCRLWFTNLRRKRYVISKTQLDLWRRDIRWLVTRFKNLEFQWSWCYKNCFRFSKNCSRINRRRLEFRRDRWRRIRWWKLSGNSKFCFRFY